MTAVSFLSLIRWEMRQLVRSKLLWLTHVIVAVTFALGAQSGAALHGAQAAAQMDSRAREQAWLKDIETRAEKYRVASDAPLPYWQDPTDVAGFSQYFLLKHSYLSHLPLAPLAVGASDLLPDRQRIRLATVFGTDDAYDFQNPRGLALGRFDLAFAVTNLLPVAIVLLTVLLCTYERDTGILRLIAAQSISPRRWFVARMASLATLTLPLWGVLFALALAFASVPLGSAWLEFSASLAILLAYALFWLALAGLVLSTWPRASSALALLCGVWLVLIVAVPLLVNGASAVDVPAITAAQEVQAKRTINDQVQAQREEIVAAGIRSNSQLAGLPPERVAEIDHATRLSFLVPELESRLQFVQDARAETRARSERIAGQVQWLAPNLGVASAFAVLAGTDLDRHRVFEAQSRQYQVQLRGFFYPLLHREVVSPTPQHLYGRFSFTAFDSIPGFEMRDAGEGDRVLHTLPTLGWLLVLGLGFVGMAVARLRRWPEVL